ncbi:MULTISPECIES: TenA family protein [unclassified Ensifer]|uniref:TenA family protein n=1 Tax=unclassified Ensifer TaxID=2633371 RepID=UPI000813C32A|nr:MULTISPECIES: TenA family protein [unclassified Ensifer]OCP00650.1 TenA family transcriptional regulator [Ensifer sp. LC14]OCP07873.1 TenA family transcriptional regulator [Ensifer sp. LC11]OCP08564.1 TenA family transcriptional regulator [Ensifer sp. LC13]OCP32144.1 TenA family transcriptional regulator [Ensifer sp. LC499]
MPTETLSQQILRENAAVFAAMVNHRFVEDIVLERLSPAVFERYLVYEGAFVDTAISIFAFATAKAETIEQKRWLIAVLDALANQQIAYFERVFAERGIDASAYDVDRPEVEAFRTGMLEIARDGGFLDTVAAMFAAEWMYWTWSKRAAGSNISDPHLNEWVEMHAHDDFAAQATWLRQQLDAAGKTLDASERNRLSAIFGRAQELEIAFHDAAYR